MKPYITDRGNGSPEAEMLENTGELYSRAKLDGSRHREFSDSHSEYRTDLRHHAIRRVREKELLTKADAEAVLGGADLPARQAEEAAGFNQSDPSIRRSPLETEKVSPASAVERLETPRRAQSEIASAQEFIRQGYNESVKRRASLTVLQIGPQSQIANGFPLPVCQKNGVPLSHTGSRQYLRGLNDTSGVRQIYREPGGVFSDSFHRPEPERSPDSGQSHCEGPLQRLHSATEEGLLSMKGQRHPDSKSLSQVCAMDSASRPPQRRSSDRRATPSSQPQTARPLSPFSQIPPLPVSATVRRLRDHFGDNALGLGERSCRDVSESLQKDDPESYRQLDNFTDNACPPIPQLSEADTLQSSRERVAARWFALKGVFEQAEPDGVEAAPVRLKETRTPVLVVFSLTGGAGKTSLVATVGRALSSMGEKVLLADTVSHGLLPFYFGASERRQGTVRTFFPPGGRTDVPLYLVGYDVEQKGSDETVRELFIEEILNNSKGAHRILLDLSSNFSWILGQMAPMNPTVLVPLTPDMNAVISLQFVEKTFHGISDGDGHPLQPFYVLNQFDASLPLHLDVREVLRRQLGDRLLPFVIRRAPSISEALAEGMTIFDYAPDTPVASDYLNVATWLRSIAGFRNVRWSESRIDFGNAKARS